MKRTILTLTTAGHLAPSPVSGVLAAVIAPELELNALRQSKDCPSGKTRVVIAKNHP